MWEQRNNLLHGAGDKVHQTTQHTIDIDIQSEWDRGLDDLPLQYAHLFTGNVQRSLQLSTNDKQRWLTSVWAARDSLNGGIQIYDRTSNLHYGKWKAKKMLTKNPAPIL
jgi:hypothetical protein